MKYNVDLELNNKTEQYGLNTVAAQSNGAAWMKSGDTVMLATITYDETDQVDGDFLPLTVQYIEKTYAAGKFPGGFFKRESKPSDFETLTSRVIDRSLRPLFPKGFAHPTQITIMVLSVGAESDLQTLALNAASAALYVSDIDVYTSVTGLRVGKVDGEVIINPTSTQMSDSTLDLYLAGSKEDMLMIEMRSIGSFESEIIPAAIIDPMIDPTMGMDSIGVSKSNAMSEDELIEILAQAQDELKKSNTAYEAAFDAHKKPTTPLNLLTFPESADVLETIKSEYTDAVKVAITKMAKSERATELRSIRKEIIAKYENFDESEVKRTLESYKRELVRAQILNEGVRADGRAVTEIRPITIETNVLPSAHSSALFTRGQTQALVVLTLGGPKDAQMFENLKDKGTQNEEFMVHYNFPGFSVGEPSPVLGPKRRELGHGNLGKRALECVLDRPSHTIRLVSEILESNGSSSMATVCGGYMALRAADISVNDEISGIAMGMVSEGGKHVILSDIMGLEDHDGDMDFKVTGSKNGITALQMDIKLGGISLDVLKMAFMQAKEGRGHIIDIMNDAVEEIEFVDALPSGDIFSIDPSMIGEIIGQAGKTIREIIEKFEVAIDIDKKVGSVKVSGTNKQRVQDARAHIEGIASAPKPEKIEYMVGDIVDGKVKKIVDFGAFIELPGGTDGLLHISKVSEVRVERVSDVLSEGEAIKVEILEFKGNKISLGRA